jgi:hypothetical protein
VVPDQAADAFARAMAAYAPTVEVELARLDRERQATTSRQLLQELRRALRGLRARLPQYELPRVDDPSATDVAAGNGAGVAPIGLPVTDCEAPDDEAGAAPPEPEETPSLFPPGPLATVRISPADIVVQAGRERRVHAVALDGEGRRVRGEVAFAWSVDHEALSIMGSGPKPLLRVDREARPGLTATVGVSAQQDGHQAEATAPVRIADRPEPTGDLAAGVPEPELVDDPGAGWRSRFDGQRWQVNASHQDYIALRGEPRTRLRYLLALFAKEVALKAHGVPGSEEALESLVEILAHAERNLSGAQGT